MKTRVLSMILAIAMLFSLVIPAFAEEGESFAAEETITAKPAYEAIAEEPVQEIIPSAEAPVQEAVPVAEELWRKLYLWQKSLCKKLFLQKNLCRK